MFPAFSDEMYQSVAATPSTPKGGHHLKYLRLCVGGSGVMKKDTQVILMAAQGGSTSRLLPAFFATAKLSNDVVRNLMPARCLQVLNMNMYVSTVKMAWVLDVCRVETISNIGS